MNGFDPIILLNLRIALLTALESAEEFVGETKGLTQAIGKIVGKCILSELEKSNQVMKENKMWVNDIPLRGYRYRYLLQGRRGEHEATEADINLHLGIVQRTLEHKISKCK
ncbi:hypothetical protein SAMN02799624_04556 [Paenibacillus sp. UNC496MF]|uniref:hypothetical protein n=1 Tax=Paenibacillus sp. UNC496MF TaxID=1502753 RepID=UPI0008EF3DC4|nr:hypothetical protein [Paenibacillus sp. UNC496MF]SFJ44606.1 hypothetical protein SAMN02799624_04556 [Paenibacillus sp. UNC496MF]